MIVALAAVAALGIGVQTQASPGAAPLTVLKIAAGPSGSVRNGTYVLDEERVTFDPARDKQIVVSFLWQGSPGMHRMTAQWKGPDGSMSVPPPVQYEAPDRRFGAYWSLTLTPSAATGTWAIEATVDGQPGGRFNFEVTPSTGAAAPVAKRPLTADELFARTSAAFVLLERTTATGERLDPAAGFAVGKGRLFTSVAAIDGADVIAAVLPDGTRQPITSVIGFNRQQDWAILAGGPAGESNAPVAAESTVQIGDRVFWIEAGNPTSKVISEAPVTGRANVGPAGPRLLVGVPGGAAAPGSAAFTEFGEVVGLLGGSLVPGATELSDLLRFRAELRGVPIIPLSLVRASPEAQPMPLAQLRERGDVLPSVQRSQHVVSGGFARSITRTQTVAPADQRREFSVRDGNMLVFISWSAQSRLKGTNVLRIYDDNNRLVAESKPAKLDLRPGDLRLSSWPLPIPSRTGVYRAEVLVDGLPIWRSFVRIVE